MSSKNIPPRNRIIDEAPHRDTKGRTNLNRGFNILCIATASLSVAALVILLGSILVEGIPSLSWKLLTSPPSNRPELAGIWPALWGTVWVCGICALITMPTGIATAILLEEFPPRSTIGRFFHSAIQLNISNLAGVPSVVYGILGLTAFVTMFGLVSTSRDKASVFEIGAFYYDQFVTESERIVLVPVAGLEAPSTILRNDLRALDYQYDPVEITVVEPTAQISTNVSTDYLMLSDSVGGRIRIPAWYNFRFPFGRGVLAGALTLMLVILPIVIISSQEAIRSVPDSLRAGAWGWERHRGR